jgi:hypothetical protein
MCVSYSKWKSIQCQSISMCNESWKMLMWCNVNTYHQYCHQWQSASLMALNQPIIGSNAYSWLAKYLCGIIIQWLLYNDWLYTLLQWLLSIPLKWLKLIIQCVYSINDILIRGWCGRYILTMQWYCQIQCVFFVTKCHYAVLCLFNIQSQ